MRPLRSWSLLLLAVAGACRTTTLPFGTPVPAFDVEWLHGAPVDPRSPGGIVVVDLWATWCGPCMGMVDDLDALQRRYAAHGVRVVAVAVRDDRASVQQFVAERGDLAYAIAFDRDGSVDAGWRNWALPTSYVVAADGVLCGATHPIALDGLIAKMLREPGYRPELEFGTDRSDALADAGRDEDQATVDRLADERLARSKHDTYAWACKVGAQRDAQAGAAVAKQALAATGDDAFALADLINQLARRGRLQAVGAEAHAALQRTSFPGPALFGRAARLRAAHAAGAEALDAVVTAMIGELREQPHELLALAREVEFDHLRPVEPPVSVHPAAAPMHAARLRLVEAAVPSLGRDRTCEPLFLALVAVNGDAARIAATGREVVASCGSDVARLNALAWALANDESRLPLTRTTALLAAEAMAKADKWETPANLDTLALARFVNGDVDGAIAAQERAIAALPRPNAKYVERLERYRGAKAPGEDK